MGSSSTPPDGQFYSTSPALIPERLSVQPDAQEQLAETIVSIVRKLRQKFESDRDLEKLLLNESGRDKLATSDTIEHSDPEALTAQEIVRPMLDSLGYSYDPEGGRPF